MNIYTEFISLKNNLFILFIFKAQIIANIKKICNFVKLKQKSFFINIYKQKFIIYSLLKTKQL